MDQRLLELERALARDPADARARLELATALEREQELARAWRVLAAAPRPDEVLAARRDALFVQLGAPYALEVVKRPDGCDAPVAPLRFSGVKKARVVLGRAPVADVRIVHPSVNRQCCLIDYTGGSSFFLVDLGGANGTWLADQRIVRVLLADGSVFNTCISAIEVAFRLGPE